MRRSLRTTRWVAVAVAAGCAALAAVLTASSPAAVDRAAAPAAHNCLVMTGSGDPAFIKNFNPYTATGQPSGSFVQGAFYEPLIVSVKARGTYKVAVTLKTPDSQFIAATVNRQFVVPKHIWSKVGDVANFTNAKPVSSGPFNRITRFTSQDYVFGKNPNYWRKGKPKIRCLEYVQESSNDAALALIQSDK